MEFLAKHFIRSTIVFILIISVIGCRKENEIIGGEEALATDTSGEVVATEPVDPAPDTITGKNNITIDNKANEVTGKPKKDSKGFEQEGVWEQSDLPGFKNSVSRYSSDPTAKVTYSTNKVGQQKYCISVYRVTHGNSIDKANYEIFDGGQSLANITVNYKYDNQKTGWYNLGEFEFTGADASVELSRDINANNGFLRADALRFKKLKDGHDCLGKPFKTVNKNGIIDNRRDEKAAKPKKDTDGYRESGNWEQSTLPGYKGLISRYSEQEDASVSYTAKVQNREYCIQVYRVTHENSVNAADVTISQNESPLAAMQIDHKMSSDQSGWVSLGRYQFNENDIVNINISRPNDVTGILRADAIRFSSKLSLCD